MLPNEPVRRPTGAVNWDNHSCMPLRPGDARFFPQLERARAAGFTVVSLNIGFGEQTPEDHLANLAWFDRWFRGRPGYRLVATPSDIQRAVDAGELAITFDIEGARAIGDDLSLVDRYYDGGVRWMLIAYNRGNGAGGGCYDDVDDGLTAFGRTLVAEMNRVGMTVCCSHTGERTSLDVLAASSRPVIFSHSNCAAVYGHLRNLSDNVIRACAAQDGVVGITGIGDFLCAEGDDVVEAYVRHVDHAVQLVGPSHVGISLDYVYDQQELLEFLASMPETFPGTARKTEVPMVAPEDLSTITAALRARGYDDAAMVKILGGNWLRIAEANWRPEAQSKSASTLS